MAGGNDARLGLGLAATEFGEFRPHSCLESIEGFAGDLDRQFARQNLNAIATENGAIFDEAQITLTQLTGQDHD